MSSIGAMDAVLENQISEGKADTFDCVASFVRDGFAARADVSAEEPRNICCVGLEMSAFDLTAVEDPARFDEIALIMGGRSTRVCIGF